MKKLTNHRGHFINALPQPPADSVARKDSKGNKRNKRNPIAVTYFFLLIGFYLTVFLLSRFDIFSSKVDIFFLSLAIFGGIIGILVVRKIIKRRFMDPVAKKQDNDHIAAFMLIMVFLAGLALLLEVGKHDRIIGAAILLGLLGLFPIWLFRTKLLEIGSRLFGMLILTLNLCLINPALNVIFALVLWGLAILEVGNLIGNIIMVMAGVLLLLLAYRNIRHISLTKD